MDITKQTYIHNQTKEQKKNLNSRQRTIFRYFLKAKDRRILSIAEHFNEDLKFVLTAITEGLNKGWR